MSDTDCYYTGFQICFDDNDQGKEICTVKFSIVYIEMHRYIKP